jgi:glycerol-3-phosphate dehydrogenase subunit B
MIGMPAVLGLHTTPRVVADMEERLGVGVFEIPTLPPSVPGFRLRESIDAALTRDGVLVLQDRQALSARCDGRRCTGLVTGAEQWTETLEADGIVLATGRFLGGGLKAEQQGIVETLFGLPVTHPGDRSLWHRDRFLDHRGHPVNEAGLEIDDLFRPLGADGTFAFENVFAAGSVLAHQDWVRTKSGAGLAVATAMGAVEAFLRLRSGN